MKIHLKNKIEFNTMIMKKGFTKSGFAKKAGISQPYMQLICSGLRNPSPVMANKILNVLEVDFDDIFRIVSDLQTAEG